MSANYLATLHCTGPPSHSLDGELERLVDVLPDVGVGGDDPLHQLDGAGLEVGAPVLSAWRGIDRSRRMKRRHRLAGDDRYSTVDQMYK